MFTPMNSIAVVYIYNSDSGKHEHTLCSVSGKVNPTDDGDMGEDTDTGEALPADGVLNTYSMPLVCMEGTHRSHIHQTYSIGIVNATF